MGKEKTVESGDVIVAGLMPISLDILARVRKTTGISHPVLITSPHVPQIPAPVEAPLRHAA